MKSDPLEGASPGLTPPLKSDPLSPEGESLGLTPPLNSGALGAVGTSSASLAGSVGASSSFTPREKSLDSSPLGISFKFSIEPKISFLSSVSFWISSA